MSTYRIERHEICIDSATGERHLFALEYEVDSRARALAEIKEFNSKYDPPERAFAHTFKHGQWLRVA